eukprot:6054571-Pyramimonas_sp.AAC.1
MSLDVPERKASMTSLAAAEVCRLLMQLLPGFGWGSWALACHGHCKEERGSVETRRPQRCLGPAKMPSTFAVAPGGR